MSEQKDQEPRVPFGGDVFYFWSTVIMAGFTILGILFLGSSMPGPTNAAKQNAIALVCGCVGLFELFDLWLAANIRENRTWAFYVSLIFALIACIPSAGSGNESSQVARDFMGFRLIGWCFLFYRIAYIIARVSGTIGPKPM